MINSILNEIKNNLNHSDVNSVDDYYYEKLLLLKDLIEREYKTCSEDMKR